MVVTGGVKALVVAVRAGVIVRPVDVHGVTIVPALPARVGVRIAGVRKMGAADAADGTDGRTEVLMIARDEQPAAAGAEPGDGFALRGTQAVAAVNGKEP